MIRAGYHQGIIEPLDDLPAEWQEGKQLEVRELAQGQMKRDSGDWLARLNAAAARIPDRVHQELEVALAEIETESKESARREMEESE